MSSASILARLTELLVSVESETHTPRGAVVLLSKWEAYRVGSGPVKYRCVSFGFGSDHERAGHYDKFVFTPTENRLYPKGSVDVSLNGKEPIGTYTDLYSAVEALQLVVGNAIKEVRTQQASKKLLDWMLHSLNT